MCSIQCDHAPGADDPARGPRRLLRVGRAAARSRAARAADRGRRQRPGRRRARRLVRGEGLRGARRDGGLAGAAAVPADHVRARALLAIPAAGRRRDGHPARGDAGGGADLDRRGVPRRDRLDPPVRATGRDRRQAAGQGAARGRAADLDRRGPDQAPGQGRLPGGQAGRAGRGRAGAGAGVPRPAAGRADVGRRTGGAAAAGRARRAHDRRAGRDVAAGAGGAARPRRRAEAGRAGGERGPAPDQRHRAGQVGRGAVGDRRATSRPRSW